MKHKENVLEALKSGPMTVEQLVEKTGIKTSVLYTVVSDLANQGTIAKEHIDGGRGRRYWLADQKNETPRYAPAPEQRPTKVPAGPVMVKRRESQPVVRQAIDMFKPGDKFLAGKRAILFTADGTYDMTTGEPVDATVEDLREASRIVALKAVVQQQVNI